MRETDKGRQEGHPLVAASDVGGPCNEKDTARARLSGSGAVLDRVRGWKGGPTAGILSRLCLGSLGHRLRSRLQGRKSLTSKSPNVIKP